jgi:sugar-specific transcriptional regulator TrmB
MNINTALQEFGLNNKETGIYLATLELGSASVPAISLKSKQPKTTCYDILEKLRHKGFVSSFQKKKTKYFLANDPEKIIRLAKEKIFSLEEKLPELRTLYGSLRHRPSLRLYEGKDQMRIILNEILEEAKELIAFASYDDVLKELGRDYLYFLKERVKQKIPLKIILPESARTRERQRIGATELRSVKIIPGTYEFHGLTYVWNNKVAMLGFQNELIGVIIEGKQLADMQRAFFFNLWNLI